MIHQGESPFDKTQQMWICLYMLEQHYSMSVYKVGLEYRCIYLWQSGKLM